MIPWHRSRFHKKTANKERNFTEIKLVDRTGGKQMGYICTQHLNVGVLFSGQLL